MVMSLWLRFFSGPPGTRTGVVAEEAGRTAEVLPRQRRVASVVVGEHVVQRLRPRHTAQHLRRCHTHTHTHRTHKYPDLPYLPVKQLGKRCLRPI